MPVELKNKNKVSKSLYISIVLISLISLLLVFGGFGLLAGDMSVGWNLFIWTIGISLVGCAFEVVKEYLATLFPDYFGDVGKAINTISVVLTIGFWIIPFVLIYDHFDGIINYKSYLSCAAVFAVMHIATVLRKKRFDK